MASFSMKSLLFLLIAASCVCSALSGLFDPVGKTVGKTFGGAGKGASKTSRNGGIKGAIIYDTPTQKRGAAKLKANKYFGPGGFNKGYRWGIKLNKRYEAVADRCENVMNTLNLTSCNQVPDQTTSCVPHCIVEVLTNQVDKTDISWCYYNSCVYPKEATCISKNLDAACWGN